MNRSSRGVVKQKRHDVANGNEDRDWHDDYEAIEAAVMETPRGRWFLSEYLRRHQNDETRRLLHSLRKLMQAQARANELARGHAAGTPPSDTAMPTTHGEAALDGIRLLLARAADDAADVLHGQPPAEHTLPDAAASRLALLLREAHDIPQAAPALLVVLTTLFERLAHMLGEPRPEPVTLCDEQFVEPAHPLPETPPSEAQAAQGPVAEPAHGTREPAQESMRAPATPAEAAPPSEVATKSPCAPRSDDSTHRPRIVIRRMEESSVPDIPLPEAERATRKKDEAETRKTTKAAGDDGKRRKIIHLAPTH